MLNMLIAIMGNTFSMVIEKKTEYSMHNKLQIMGEYCYVVRFFEKIVRPVQQDHHKYMFVVKPILDDEEKED